MIVRTPFIETYGNASLAVNRIYGLYPILPSRHIEDILSEVVDHSVCGVAIYGLLLRMVGRYILSERVEMDNGYVRIAVGIP